MELSKLDMNDPDLQSIHRGLRKMIIHIDSEWGHETDDVITEWAEVFNLTPRVIAWLKGE